MPQLDEALVRQLHTLGFVDSAHNVVLVGGPGTVKTHLGSIQAKLGVRNRVEIAARMWESGRV